ncbi:MFS transporter [Bacillus sp. RAR_GA_16]|uniref:MFS transporter n=1 Tax=Bacillus sp. RAR_GA_16 TaxID=2876774 RepID=UPI001CCB482E|nr:MFS transporter [Bacillus sp. RAR_GA_16]MCA0174538.1 MFS transporter [Bacillus sp. RAR_GA_16]
MNNQEVTIRHKRDIIDYVNNNPSSRKGLLIVLVALGGVFVDAYDFASLAIGIDQITEQFGLTPFEVGSLTAVMAVGALLGAFFGGVLTDKIGRNKMFTLTLILLVISAFGVALSFNLASLIIFRFLLGVGVGLDVPVALSFIAEVSNTKRKGQMVNLWQPMWYAAASFTGLVILPLYFFGAEENLWRYAVGFGGVAALVILLLRLKYMDESPMWAANNLSLEEASKVLEKTYDIKVRLNKIKTIENKEKESKPSLSMIFSKRYRVRTFLASMIASTQSIEYFAVGFYIPTISILIFGKGIIYGIIGTLLFNFFGIVGGLTQSFATSKLGIRKLAIIGYTIVCICLLTLGLMGDNLPLILTTLLVGGFIFGHSFGPGSQGMSFATLSYPTSLRGIGSGWGQTMVRVGSIIGFLFFPIVLSLLGLHKTLLVLTIVPLLGLICTLAIQWDPTMIDIENEDEEENESAVLQRRNTQNL